MGPVISHGTSRPRLRVGRQDGQLTARNAVSRYIRKTANQIGGLAAFRKSPNQPKEENLSRISMEGLTLLSKSQK